MRAAVYRSYGPPDVLQIEQLDKPSPQDDEVLVRVQASSVNPAEWYSMIGMFVARLGSGLLRPKDPRLGTDYAGVVEAVGKSVTGIKPGDAVYGARSGAFAEYVCARKMVIPMPENLPFEQAGGVGIAAATALQALRDHGKLQAGEKVLINGASGGVGTFTVQMARALGGVVTGVCSPANVEMVRSLGAQQVIDYTRDDFTRSGERYDLVIDIAGSRPWSELRRVLTPQARVVMAGFGGPSHNRWIGPLGKLLRSRLAFAAARPSQKLIFFVATFQREDFLLFNDWFASGQLRTVIDRVYPLEQIAEAMRHLGAGHARGKIIVSMR